MVGFCLTVPLRLPLCLVSFGIHIPLYPVGVSWDRTGCSFRPLSLFWPAILISSCLFSLCSFIICPGSISPVCLARFCVSPRGRANLFWLLVLAILMWPILN